MRRGRGLIFSRESELDANKLSQVREAEAVVGLPPDKNTQKHESV